MKRIIVLLALLITKVAYADSVVVNGGWQHTSSSAYDDSGTVSVRYEKVVTPNLSLGPEYTYHGSMAHRNGQDVSYGDVSGHSLLLDAIYYPTVSWKIKPYLIGGAGWSWWSFDSDQLTRDSGVTVDLGDSFAYKVGLGTDYPLNDSWSLNLEWSFFRTEIPKDARHSDGSESAILGDDGGKIGEEETRLIAGVRHKF